MPGLSMTGWNRLTLEWDLPLVEKGHEERVVDVKFPSVQVKSPTAHRQEQSVYGYCVSPP